VQTSVSTIEKIEKPKKASEYRPINILPIYEIVNVIKNKKWNSIYQNLNV